MTRLHLAESAEPIVQGSTIRALCGAEIQFAAAVRLPEDDGNNISNCRRCIMVRLQKDPDRYLYVLQNAQEAKLEGNDAD